MFDRTVVVSIFLAVVLGASTTNTLARQSSTPLDRTDIDAVVSRFLASAERYEQTFRDLAAEETKTNDESMKYEFGMHWVGFTTNQAGKNQRNLFTFEWLGEDSLDGHDVVRIRYQQTTPRPGSFDVRLPSAFVPHSFLTRGTLWLDRQTARVWRSEEEYTVRHRTIPTPFVWARIEKTYASSSFDINVPERIVLTRFSRYRHAKGEADALALQDRTTLTYANFRRFGVASETEYQLPAAPGDGSR